MASRTYGKVNRRVENIYFDGNTVRKFDVYEPSVYRRQRRKDVQYAVRTQKIDNQKKLIRFLCVGAAATFFIGMCVWMLVTNAKSIELNTQIRTLESQYEELAAQNDSREYDINSSVDLNHIVQVATEEFGMVRSSSDQIKTYNSQTSEYVQQLAEIPTE